MKKDQYVLLKTMTWARDSHGLFDYESKNIQKKNIRANCSGKLIRISNEVQFLSEKIDTNHVDDRSNLAHISLAKGQYSISPFDENQPLWLALRVTKSNEDSKCYNLNEGSIIKLGRVKFKISALHTSSFEPLTFIQGSSENFLPEESVCRICLCDSNDQENPLISPCICKGTMKHIHVQCLQKWVSSKFSTKTGPNSEIFCWKSMDCELCKSPYPASVQVGRRVYAIFTSGDIQTPYCMIESMSRDSNNHRMLYLVSFKNKCSITMGRGHDSDLRVSDISVSRMHAMIRYVNGKFILEDNSSKFGTLVMLQEPKKVEAEDEFVMQIGRTVFEVSIKSGIRGDASIDEDF